VKKFRFPLQRLLEIREKKENQQKIVLAKVSGEYQLEVQRREKFFGNVKRQRERLSQVEKMDLNSLRNYDRIDLDAREASNAMESIIEEKKQKMTEQMEKYVVLKRDRRAVELLKEKALKAYVEEENRVEQQKTNEIGQNIYLRHQAQKNDSDNLK